MKSADTDRRYTTAGDRPKLLLEFAAKGSLEGHVARTPSAGWGSIPGTRQADTYPEPSLRPATIFYQVSAPDAAHPPGGRVAWARSRGRVWDGFHRGAQLGASRSRDQKRAALRCVRGALRSARLALLRARSEHPASLQCDSATIAAQHSGRNPCLQCDIARFVESIPNQHPAKEELLTEQSVILPVAKSGP